MSTILSLKFIGASSISMKLDVIYIYIYIYIILLGGSRTGSETSSAVRVCWCWCIPRTYHASAANHLDAAAGGSYLYGERRSSMMRLTPASVSTWHAASPTQRAVATLSHDDPVTHTHTHTFNGPLSGTRTTRVSRYQKGKTNLDFTEARDSEWQWHQLGRMPYAEKIFSTSGGPLRPVAFATSATWLMRHWCHVTVILCI